MCIAQDSNNNNENKTRGLEPLDLSSIASQMSQKSNLGDKTTKFVPPACGS